MSSMAYLCSFSLVPGTWNENGSSDGKVIGGLVDSYRREEC